MACFAEFLALSTLAMVASASRSGDSASRGSAFVQPHHQDHVKRHKVTVGVQPRVIFSLTTIRQRIAKVKPVVDAIVQGQTHTPDVVYLAVPPNIGELPEWLSHYNYSSARPGTLKVLHMGQDYGPASKLLAALREGQERSEDTLIIYGDDDVIYSPKIVELHVAAHRVANHSTAFGSRLIRMGGGRHPQKILEATGSISVRASWLPESAFAVAEMPNVCRMSDDYWISQQLAQAGVSLGLLEGCIYNYKYSRWPDSCGTPFRTVPEIEHIRALSKPTPARLRRAERTGITGRDYRLFEGWRNQISRYESCQQILKCLNKTKSGDACLGL